jgi:hypothetical protein
MKLKVTTLIAACLLLGLLAACNNYGTKLTYKKGELYYTSSVNESDAKKLGDFLDKNYFTDDKEATVQLNKEGDTYQVKFVVKDGAEKDQTIVDNFHQFGAQISKEVFKDQKVEIHLTDNTLKTVKVV